MRRHISVARRAVPRLDCQCGAQFHPGVGDGRKNLRYSRAFTLSCKVICPTGGVGEFLSSPRAKNILLPFFGNIWFVVAIPPCQEGRLAIVTNVGWDAVDAGSATDERVACGR